MSIARSAVVRRYFLYKGAATVGFLSPFWVVLLEYRGLTFTSIALLDAVFFTTMLLAEIPTGFVGDRIGRRNALIVSSVVVGVSVVGFAFARTTVEFLVVYVGWGVSQTFRTGNESAWLYDTLSETGETAAFSRVRGRGQAVLFGVTAIAALVGGYLATRNIVWPFLATGAVNAVAAVVLLTLPEPTVETEAPTFSIRDALGAIARLGRPGLRGFVAFVALFLAVGWAADLYVQPISTRAGVSLVGLGGIYAVMTAGSAVTSTFAGTIRERVGGTRTLLVLPFVVGVGYLLFAVTAAVAVPAFVLARGLLSLAQPLAEHHVNERTPALGRATVLSGFSMAVSFLTVPLQLMTGPLADTYGLFTTIAALGAILLVGAVVLAVGSGILEESI